MTTKVLLVDDHHMIRAGVRSLLRAHSDYEIVGEVSLGTEAIAFCKQQRVDILITDLNLPDIGGIDTTAEVLRNQPDIKVIVLSMHDDDASVFGAVRAGARGFVLKTASGTDVVTALAVVARGGTYFSPPIANRVLNKIQRRVFEGQGAAAVSPLEKLAPREAQIVRLVAQGKTSKEVAHILDLGVETVRSYRKAAMRKMGASNAAELIRMVIDHES